MKELYIPTTTLNLNNILSSESISPKAFYGCRGFGFQRWETIPENNVENAIILYEKSFKFIRPKGETEDHPMFVKIETDEEFPSVGEGVYYCDRTIYLSPWRTKFVFFSEENKKTALSLAVPSLEIKIGNLYREKGCFEVDKKIEGKVPKVKVNELNLTLNEVEIERDRRINKMKGLLYGYYIGALLSTTPELARWGSTLQELRNIFGAILASEVRKPTPFQDKRLDECIREVKEIEIWVKWLPIMRKVFPDIRREQGEELIDKFIENESVFPGLNSKQELVFWLNGGEEDRRAMNWLEEREKHLNEQKLKGRKRLSTYIDEIVLNGEDGCKLVKIGRSLDTLDDILVKTWVNEVLSSSEFNGKVSTFVKELSDKVTSKAKDVLGQNWEKSEERKMLNEMRREVRGEENHFNWGDSLLISSIAAVIKKGSEWEEMLSFMRDKGISDYRLACAFYGELNGFANLGWDFTDNLLRLEDRKYVDEVYVEFYGQLLGKEPRIKWESCSAAKVNQTIENSTFEKNCNDVASSEKESRTEKTQQKSIQQSIKANGDEGKAERRKGNRNKGDRTYQEPQLNFSNDDFLMDSNQGEAKLRVERRKENKSLNNGEENSTQPSFFNDSIETIMKYLDTLELRDDEGWIKKELNWIKDVYKKGGYSKSDGSYQSCKDRSNGNMLQHFRNNACRKKENKDIVNKVYNKLKEVYR